MIRLELEAENLPALQTLLAQLMVSMSPVGGQGADPAPAPAPVLKGEVLPPVDAKAPGKRGPKPKAPAEDAPAAPPLEAPAAEADAPKPPSYDEVVNACKNLLGAKGMPALRELLQKFNVEQTKALKPEQYAEVITQAKAAEAATA